MKKDHLKYKGYEGTIETSIEDDILFGTIAFINDTVTYEAETITKLKEEFHSAVDHYLKLCEKVGKEPDKPFKGIFNVRISPELHKEAVKQGGKNEKR